MENGKCQGAAAAGGVNPGLASGAEGRRPWVLSWVAESERAR